MGEPPYKLLLIDEDPIFRLGLRTMLGQFSDLMVVAEADSSTIAFQILDGSGLTKTEQLNTPPKPLDTTLAPSAPKREGLVILDVGLGQRSADSLSSLELCPRLKQQYPSLGVLAIGHSVDPVLLRKVQRVGADGFCSKRVEIAEMVTAIRRIVAGEQYGWEILDVLEPMNAQPMPSRRSPNGFTQRLVCSFQQTHQQLRNSGLRQIDGAIVQANLDLDQRQLSWFDRTVWAGRCRELRAARQLVTLLLPEIQAGASGENIDEQASWTQADRGFWGDTQATTLATPSSKTAHNPVFDLILGGNTKLTPSTEQAKATIVPALMDATVAQLQAGLGNLTKTTLEIDILKPDKKRQLLYLVLRKFEDLLEELRFSNVQPNQLVDKQNQLLLDLWEAVTNEFFGRYYALAVRGQSQEVVPTLLLDRAIVEAAILKKIPLVEDLLAHLLFQTPLRADQDRHVVGSPEAMQRSQALLQNLMIQVANAVIQPVLNHFAHAETLKQTFYDRRLLSTREIERFRNDLSWKYRLTQYVSEPTAIFESQFPLFVLSERGIQQIKIYAPRNQELDHLQGISSLVPLLLELRDAVSPRLRSAVSLIGSGLVYVLTEVIGRGIGLVGRGIIHGIGNAFQDARFKERGK